MEFNARAGPGKIQKISDSLVTLALACQTFFPDGVDGSLTLARAELPAVTVAMAHKTTQTRVIDVVQNNEINSDVLDHIVPLEELFHLDDFNQTDSNLARQLSDTREELATEATAKFEVVSSAATASAGFTLGYIFWWCVGNEYAVLAARMAHDRPAAGAGHQRG